MSSPPTTNVPVAIPPGSGSGPASASPAPATIVGSLSGLPGARTVASRLLHGTPGRMRLMGLLTVVAALVLGAVSVSALLTSQNAVDRAATNTSQVVLAQSLHVDLLRADAVATNAFLVGGLEPPSSRQAYESAMASVASGIAQASAAQPADAEALGVLSTQVQQYAALVEQARTNNRSGLPVGAQYLKQASAGLRTGAIPTVTAVVTANEQRAKAEFDRSNSTLRLVAGVVALLVLIWVALWLARLTHRYLNLSLTAGVVLVLVGLVVAAVTISTISQATKMVANGDYRQAVALADVRTFANDARANESLTLIARGSGQANEDAWITASDEVGKRLDTLRGVSTLTSQWKSYTDAHGAIRALDQNGSWDQAVVAATKTTGNSATTVFNAFDTSVTLARDRAADNAVSQLRSVGGSAPWIALAIALATLVACWLSVRGIGKRLEEYR